MALDQAWNTSEVEARKALKALNDDRLTKRLRVPNRPPTAA